MKFLHEIRGIMKLFSFISQRFEKITKSGKFFSVKIDFLSENRQFFL